MKIYDATHRYENPNDETPHQRIDLLQQDVDVFPGVQNRSMSNIVNREAEFLGGSVFTVKDKNESVRVWCGSFFFSIVSYLMNTKRNHIITRRTTNIVHSNTTRTTGTLSHIIRV